MKFEEIKKQFVGKKLLTIIDLDITESYIIKTIKEITKDNSSHSLENAHLLLFEDKSALVFVDFDCDGYRSGDWNLIQIKEVLDKGQTKGIKTINSIVRDIQSFKEKNIPDTYSVSDGVLITTDEYIINMGQNNSDSYYPSNFFNVDECKSVALKGAELVEFETELEETK
jgi:hypothetical protein